MCFPPLCLLLPLCSHASLAPGFLATHIRRLSPSLPLSILSFKEFPRVKGKVWLTYFPPLKSSHLSVWFNHLLMGLIQSLPGWKRDPPAYPHTQAPGSNPCSSVFLQTFKLLLYFLFSYFFFLLIPGAWSPEHPQTGRPAASCLCPLPAKEGLCCPLDLGESMGTSRVLSILIHHLGTGGLPAVL